CTGGGANVLSHTVNGPVIEPIASRSITSRPGLAGDSTNTSCVLPGRTAARTASVAVASTKVTSMPKRGHSIVKSWLVTENVEAWATMWSPVEQNVSTTEVIAPIPDPNARAASAPSSAATASSNSITVGLPLRL